MPISCCLQAMVGGHAAPSIGRVGAAKGVGLQGPGQGAGAAGVTSKGGAGAGDKVRGRGGHKDGGVIDGEERGNWGLWESEEQREWACSGLSHCLQNGAQRGQGRWARENALVGGWTEVG